MYHVVERTPFSHGIIRSFDTEAEARTFAKGNAAVTGPVPATFTVVLIVLGRRERTVATYRSR